MGFVLDSVLFYPDGPKKTLLFGALVTTVCMPLEKMAASTFST